MKNPDSNKASFTPAVRDQQHLSNDALKSVAARAILEADKLRVDSFEVESPRSISGIKQQHIKAAQAATEIILRSLFN